MKIVIRLLNFFAAALTWCNINLELLPKKITQVWLSTIIAILIWPFRFVLNLPYQLIVSLNYYHAYKIFMKRNNMTIELQEPVPSGPGVLYLPNHQAWTDPWAVGYALLKLVGFVRFIFSPAIMHWTLAEDRNYGQTIYGPYLTFSKMVTIMRPAGENKISEAKKALLRELKHWQKLLRISNLLIYFEGTRSREGNKLTGECVSGVSKLIYDNLILDPEEEAAIKYIVPIRLVDFYKIQPPEEKSVSSGAKLKMKYLAKGQNCKVIVGKAISLEELKEAIEWEEGQGEKPVRKKIATYIINNVENLLPVEQTEPSLV